MKTLKLKLEALSKKAEFLEEFMAEYIEYLDRVGR